MSLPNQAYFCQSSLSWSPVLILPVSFVPPIRLNFILMRRFAVWRRKDDHNQPQLDVQLIAH